MAVKSNTTNPMPRAKAQTTEMNPAAVLPAAGNDQDKIVYTDFVQRRAKARATLARLAFASEAGAAVTNAMRQHFAAWINSEDCPDKPERAFGEACAAENTAMLAFLATPVATRQDQFIKGQYLATYEKVGEAFGDSDAVEAVINSWLNAKRVPHESEALATDAVFVDIPTAGAPLKQLMAVYTDLRSMWNALTGMVEGNPIYARTEIGEAIHQVANWLDAQRSLICDATRARVPTTLLEVEQRHAVLLEDSIWGSLQEQLDVISETADLRQNITVEA